MMIFRLDIPVRREEQELFLPRPSWSQQYRLNKLTAAPALLHSSVTEQYLQDHRQIEIVGKIAKSFREDIPSHLSTCCQRRLHGRAEHKRWIELKV